MLYKLTLFILISILNLSCQNNSQQSEKEINSKELWKTDYKNVVFKRCIFLGLNKSEEIRAVLDKDRSTHQDFAYGIMEYKFIDSIVRPIIQNAKIDSINFYKGHLEGRNEIERDELNGLPIIRYCLEYYSSNELENLATKRVINMKYLWE